MERFFKKGNTICLYNEEKNTLIIRTDLRGYYRDSDVKEVDGTKEELYHEFKKLGFEETEAKDWVGVENTRTRI